MDKETSEITKLTERVSKDPKSKLFVPLAEEYKKAGDLEMAIHVLTEGLKNNPGYVTARAILGRLLLERGDIAGSQKELEEVVKIIPDNLLAQRKLGDICVLQGKPAEALKHYKSVIALNARDEEITSIISDIEAGRDVRSKISHSKLQTPQDKAVQPDVKPQTTGVITEQKKGGSPSAPAAGPASLKEQETGKASAATPKAASVEAPTHEEPEEILIVEPLEREGSKQVPNAGISDHRLEPGNAQTVSPPEGVEATEPLISRDGVSKDSTEVGRNFSQPEILKEQEERSAQRSDSGQEIQEKSDDFTTDTLAELYIAQGFYEKAIDIYGRMLADNPGNTGLKDKLDRVKAMAATAGSEEIEKGGSDIFAEPQVYSAQQEQPADKQESSFGEPQGETVAAKTKEWPATVSDKTDDLVRPGDQEFGKSKPIYTDFEPREYTPPKTESIEAVPEQSRVAPKSSAANRKETIHRLEAWLKNIKKEK